MSDDRYCICCNTTVYAGYVGSCFCVNCNKDTGGFLHENCTEKKGEQGNRVINKIKDCVNCTSDKTRMRVEISLKIKYLIEHYNISEENCNKLCSEIPPKMYYPVNRFITVCKQIIDDTFVNQYDSCLPILYDFLIKKYGLLDENIVEIIKDKWYIQRTGCLIKRAMKSK